MFRHATLISILMLSIVGFSSSFTFGDPAMEQAPAAPAAQEAEGTERDTDPNEIRRGIRMGGENGRSREQVRYERLISGVEPDLKGSVDRLEVYTRLFETELVQDTRIFPAKVNAEAGEDGTIRLTGYVGFAENKEALGNLFKYLGFEKVNNEVEVLPSESLGDKKFGLVIAPVAFSFDKPEEPHERMTQGFVGDPVYLLRKSDDGDFYLVQTLEGYVGYMAAEAIRPVNATQFAEYQSGPQVTFKKDFEVEGLKIPQGARLKAAATHGSDDQRMVVLPTGKEFSVPAAISDYRDGEVNPRVKEVLEIADQIEGSKYVWGGKSSEGVDCSGLVQSSYKAIGVNLARDAYQQAYSGNMVATRWYPQGMRPGDMMYFLGGDGRIHHTALYVGGGKFIEASGTVKYTSMNPEDENYSERRAKSFAFAKRVLE